MNCAALVYSPCLELANALPYRTLPLPQGDWRAVAISGDSNLVLVGDSKGRVYTGPRTGLLECVLEMGGKE